MKEKYVSERQEFKRKINYCQALVAHAYNPSYLGGRDRRTGV
jgi:hypothetical protein